LESRDQRGKLGTIVMDSAFGGERCQLIGIETLAPRVGQQPIQAPRDVAQMETDCGHTPWPSPELDRREVLHDRKHIFSDLEYSVGGGLQQRLDAGDRAPQPDFSGYRQAIPWSSAIMTGDSFGPAEPSQ
jgi:hypothetical protein